MIAQALKHFDQADKALFQQICIDAIASKFENPAQMLKKVKLIKQGIEVVH